MALEMCPERAPGKDNFLLMPAISLSPAWLRGTKLPAHSEATSVKSGHRKAEPEDSFVFSKRMGWTSGQPAPLPSSSQGSTGMGKLLLNLLT